MTAVEDRPAEGSVSANPMEAEQGTPGPVWAFLASAAVAGLTVALAAWAVVFAFRSLLSAQDDALRASLSSYPLRAGGAFDGLGRFVAAYGAMALYVAAAVGAISMVVHTSRGYAAWLRQRGVTDSRLNTRCAVAVCASPVAGVWAAAPPAMEPWLGEFRVRACILVGSLIVVLAAAVLLLAGDLDRWMHARERADERAAAAKRAAARESAEARKLADMADGVVAVIASRTPDELDELVGRVLAAVKAAKTRESEDV